jgi:hypothetical protein
MAIGIMPAMVLSFMAVLQVVVPYGPYATERDHGIDR